MGRGGIEPPTHGFSVRGNRPETPDISADWTIGAAPALHPAPDSAVSDPDLRLLIEAWPALPEALRAGIMAMVRASGG